jgi:hypothetical protein
MNNVEKADHPENAENAENAEKPEKPEKPGKDEKPASGAQKFDWVTKRSACSIPKIFKDLRLQVEEDVKIRNGLRPNNSPYEFSVADQGTDFSVILKMKDTEKSVLFSVSGQAILVTADHGKEMFKVTAAFNDIGECKLCVNEQELEMWQVRRMALEEILFAGQ